MVVRTSRTGASMSARMSTPSVDGAEGRDKLNVWGTDGFNRNAEWIHAWKMWNHHTLFARFVAGSWERVEVQ